MRFYAACCSFSNTHFKRGGKMLNKISIHENGKISERKREICERENVHWKATSCVYVRRKSWAKRRRAFSEPCLFCCRCVRERITGKWFCLYYALHGGCFKVILKISGIICVFHVTTEKYGKISE